MGQQGEGDVAVPGVVAADLAVVKAGLVLGRLEALLDSPAEPATRISSSSGVRPGRSTVVSELQLILALRAHRAAQPQVPSPAARCPPRARWPHPSRRPGALGAVPQLRRLHAWSGACAARALAREVPASPVIACLLSTATT